jgi:ABC-type transporter Mla subunit MlaD
MQFDSAIAKAQRVVDIANQHPMQVRVDIQNLPALLKAAKAHDTNFVSHFTVPSADSEFSLYVKPHP